MTLPAPYYHDETSGITLYCADCRDVLPFLSGFDVVITDPPYGVDFAGKNTKHTIRRKSGYISIEDTPDYIESVVLPVVRSLVADGRRMVVTPGSRNMFAYPKPQSVGSIYYPAGAGLGPWGFVCSQPIFYYGRDPYLARRQGHRPDSFSSTEAAADNGHPCPKPIKTMRWLVAKASLPGETVLDPFAGSGTTLVAAKALGRRAIGIEIEERYCEIAVRRLAQAVLPLEVPA